MVFNRKSVNQILENTCFSLTNTEYNVITKNLCKRHYVVENGLCSYYKKYHANLCCVHVINFVFQHMIADTVRLIRQCQKDHMGEDSHYAKAYP